MSATDPVLDFDTAEAFGFDGTGTDGDRRFPYRRTDAVAELNRLADQLLRAGVLAVHDGALPYELEIVATRTDKALYARLAAEFGTEVEHSGDTEDYLAISESALNIDADSGRIDPDLPLTDAHVRLYALLRGLGDD